MMKFFILNILFTLFARDYALFVCEGDGFFPDPYDCVKFYRCHSGRVFEFSCGPGTHFNPNHNGCDWPSAVGCQPLVPESQAQPSGYNQQYNQQHNRQPNQQSSHRHHSHQNHRQPEESIQTDSRYQSPQTAYQNPYDNTYEQQNRGYDRRQQRYPETGDTTEYSGNSDTNYGNRENIGTNNRQVNNRNKVRPQPKPYPENRRTDNRFTDEDNFDHDFDERVTESVNRERQPNKQKARPKPKSQQYPEDRITDQNYEYPENTDNNYDGITGRQKDRVRPQQRPYVEDNQPIGYGRQQERDENDWQTRRTTSRYRAPPARNRIRTTVRTTEDPNSNEEEEDEFSQLFQNELRKDSEEPTDSNNWFDFNAFDDQDIESTTEDLFVSMLKSKVPVIQNNLDSHRNRSRIDKNRKQGSQPVSTLAPIRSRMRTTPTLDPFKADWLAFNSGTNNRNNYNNKRPDDSIQSSAEVNFKRKPFKDDPLLIPDLISYFNCSEAGKNCDTCQELDWIKYSGTGLQALPFRSFKFHSKIVSKQCYKACSESQQCIGFSYSLTSGMCHIYDQITTDDLHSSQDFNSVIQNPKSNVLLEEWVHTKNGFISGQESSSHKTDDLISCVRKCAKEMNVCKAITFDLVDNWCKLFDESEGYSLNTLKANSVSLQHFTLFDDKNEWRFEDMGHKTLNNSQPINTLAVNEEEECFYECLENSNNNCTYVTIEENDNQSNNEENSEKLCHLFAFDSTPNWVESEAKTNKSYILNVPKNHSRVQEYSGYTFVGNPVEILQNLSEDECREYAEEKCTFCRKYTSIIETRECALFSDSALLSPSLSEKNYTEKSSLISIPKDSEYMAFKRIPWKMFTTDITPYELKGEINGHKCITFCLQQKQCLVTALVYDTVESSLFCYFFKQKDLQNANFTEYENVELFVKILEENEIPGHMSNRSQDCSDGEPLDDAVKNVNDLDGNIGRVSKRPSDNSYNANSLPLSPHGYDYYGGPKEQNSNKNSRQQNIRNVRDVNNQFKEDEESNTQISDPNANALAFVNSVKQNSKKKTVLQNIPTISADLRKAAKKKRLDSKPKKSIGKLSTNCENINNFDRDNNHNTDNECNDNNDSNQESDKCIEMPSIIYSDVKQMNSCKDSVIGGECEIICRSGYEPNEPKVQCEKSGNRNVWKSKHIKCLPIESNCEEVNYDKNTIRLKASTKYPNEKLHYISRYDKSKKLPQFAVYTHTKENNNRFAEPSNRFTKNSCKLLNGQQLTISDYKKSDYNPKPLFPKNAFLYSKEAQTLNNYLANTAPQDPFTSRGPWNTLENRTLEMLKTRPGIVITGVCPQTISSEIKTSDKTLNIPECFWSIVCVPFENGVTSAVFYGENTHPISQLEKQSRVEQIRQYRDQRFIARLLGTDLYRNVWYETYNAYKDGNKGIKAFISRCAETKHNSPEAIGFWDNVINGDNSGQKWQSMFTYGLEKSDQQMKNDTNSRSIDEQNLVSGKRSIGESKSYDFSSNEANDLMADKNDNNCENKIIGYMTSWGNKSFTVNEGSLLTHAIFAHIHMDSEGNSGPFDSEQNENRVMFTKLYEMLAVKTKLLGKNHELKTMVSFGGWNNSEHFSSIASSPEYRNNFISSALNIIDYWNLEGIEIDWKYPVIGGSKVGKASDRENFVVFLRQIRLAFKAYEREKQRSEPLLLSITGASGYWLIEESYDLENIIPLVDWINVLTYDYFGPWKSKWGANTGPNAPLYSSAPIDSLSKMNIHSTIGGYVCRLNSTDKLVMSIPFYGHYWNNVGEPIDTKDNHFRDAHPVGGFVPYSNIKNKWLLNKEFEQFMHNKSLTPYLWSEYRRVLLSYENSKSIEDKLKYAIDHKLGGVSVWALDFDDNQNELLNTIAENYKSCDSSNDDKHSEDDFKCNSHEKKWWTSEDGPNEGLCGRSAPLINGYYPVCDPDNNAMRCCSSWGRCGSGPQYCECEGCVDYKKFPHLMTKEPVKPKDEIRWLTIDKQPNGNENEDEPNCGYNAQLLNGSYPICNPDDDNAHCCSAEGLCGVGSKFCNCKDCINFRKKPKYVYQKKLWWDQNDGLHKAGRCGKLAPKMNGSFPICNPYSSEAYCCGKWGFCGSGPISCDCVSCVNFKSNPFFRWDSN